MVPLWKGNGLYTDVAMSLSYIPDMEWRQILLSVIGDFIISFITTAVSRRVDLNDLKNNHA